MNGVRLCQTNWEAAGVFNEHGCCLEILGDFVSQSSATILRFWVVLMCLDNICAVLCQAP